MILSVNSVNLLIFVVVKCNVLFEVRTEFLNSIQKTWSNPYAGPDWEHARCADDCQNKDHDYED
jgi:hypothetical protein